MATDKAFPTRIDIRPETRTAMVALLNRQLAAITDLFTQTKFSHWNVKGPQFIALHKLFDELAEKVEDAVDDVAERATALGGVALGTARMTVAASPLKEFPAGVFAGSKVVAALAEQYAAVGKGVRDAITQATAADDAGTADLFTGIVRMLDQALYFLEAHGEAAAGQ